MEHIDFAALTDPSLRRFTNPTDHAGRKAYDIDKLRESGTDPGEMLCPECRSPMDVRGGGDRARHFYHTRNNATRNCGGTHETAWHLACKIAAVHGGWSKEHTVDLPQGRRRADAYKEGEFLEFIHSLSDTYARKHRQLFENGIRCRWIVDSAASFHSPYGSEQFDFAAALEGTMRVRGLLKPKDAFQLDAIGHESLYIYYRSAIWKCIGHDEWQLSPQDHELQVLCTMDGGINNELVLMSQRKKDLGIKVDCRPEMNTNWRTQVEYLIEEVFAARSVLLRVAQAILESKETRYFAAPPSEDHSVKQPVCRRTSQSRYLTHEQARLLITEAECRLSKVAETRIAAAPVAVPAGRPNSYESVWNRSDSSAIDIETASAFRVRCRLHDTHELEDVVVGDVVTTSCKWCGKFCGKSPAKFHRPLLAFASDS